MVNLSINTDTLSAVRYKYRSAFILTSMLGPIVALLGMNSPIQMVKNLSSTLTNEANNPLLIIIGLFLIAFVYIALFASPWITYKAKTIAEFKQIHAFGVAVAITMILSNVLSHFSISWSLRNLSIFLLSRWILLFLYEKASHPTP